MVFHGRGPAAADGQQPHVQRRHQGARRLPRRQGQQGPARLRRVLRADLRRQGHRRPDVLAVPRARLPGAQRRRLPRRSRRRLGPAAERVPAGHRQPVHQALQGRPGQHPEEAAAAGREPARCPTAPGRSPSTRAPIKQWASFQISHQPGQRSRPHRRDRRHRAGSPARCSSSGAGSGSGPCGAPTASPSSRWRDSAAASPRSSPRSWPISPARSIPQAPTAPDPGDSASSVVPAEGAEK